MVNGYSLDPHPNADFAKEQFAVVNIPRVKRDRVPAGNVEVMDSLEDAIKSAKNREHFMRLRSLAQLALRRVWFFST